MGDLQIKFAAFVELILNFVIFRHFTTNLFEARRQKKNTTMQQGRIVPY